MMTSTPTNRKTASTKQATTRIHFENRGQELTWIDTDDSGEVIDTHENHALIWRGRFIELETANPCEYPEYLDLRTGARDQMNYRVKRVEPINREE